MLKHAAHFVRRSLVPRRRFAQLLILVLVLFTWSPMATAQMSSPSYRLEPVAFATAGAESAAAGYHLVGTLGQAMAVGTSASPYYVIQSGFWGFVGSGLVPVILTVSKPAVDTVRLDWSGNNPPYDIYRTTDCSAVFSGFYASTPNPTFDDTSPPPGLTCYSVLATAPGFTQRLSTSPKGGQQ